MEESDFGYVEEIYEYYISGAFMLAASGCIRIRPCQAFIATSWLR
jgi:hypothetical protein